MTNPFKKWKPQRLLSGKVRPHSGLVTHKVVKTANIENPKIRKEMTLEDLKEARKQIMEKRIELHDIKD